MRAMSKSDRKLAMREQAKRKVRPKSSAGASTAYRQEVESGRREFGRVSSEGGDSNVQKVKGELTYLLNNYLPTYDARIQMLIDQWRRSGDPSYDPSIKTKHRMARRDHMTKGNAV